MGQTCPRFRKETTSIWQTKCLLPICLSFKGSAVIAMFYCYQIHIGMEELRLSLEEIKVWIRDLYFFLNDHRDITSAHTVDFFTCNHWETIVKPSWREELLTVSYDEQLVKPSTGGPPGIVFFIQHTYKMLYTHISIISICFTLFIYLYIPGCLLILYSLKRFCFKQVKLFSIICTLGI